jgi:hypothetical protein
LKNGTDVRSCSIGGQTSTIQNPVESLMTSLTTLTEYSGQWRGTNRLHDPNTGSPADSPTTATITPMLDGKFVRVDYTWRYQDTPQAGSWLIGYEAEARVLTGHWIDSWHMGDKVMACRGSSADERTFSLLGSFAAPPGPDWGWRTVFALGEEAWSMIMTLISPEGEEYPAVEAHYTAAKQAA